MVPKIYKELELAFAARSIRSHDTKAIASLSDTTDESLEYLYEHYLKEKDAFAAQKVARVIFVRVYAIYSDPALPSNKRATVYPTVIQWFKNSKLL